MVELEKGILLPDRGRSGGRARGGWPELVRRMEVGDSFFMEGLESARNAHGYFYRAAKELGYRLATRKVEGGVRVWRLE